MSDWRNLPNEVLSIIFQLLPPKGKSQCSLTCRAWKSAAQRALFNSIRFLNDEKMYKLTTALSHSDPDQSPGNFVKILSCIFLNANFDIESLNTRFPFLEVIHLSAHQQKLYDKICQIITKGGFTNLKTVPYIRWDKKHAEFVLTRKKYIKELELRDAYFDNGTYDVFSELHHFPKIESLFLFCSHINRRVSLEGLLKHNIPTLTTIKFEFENDSRILLDTSAKDMSNIQPLIGVRDLTIFNRNLFSNGNDAFLYFMKKFPDLDKLDLLSYEDPFRMRNRVAPTLDCLSQFLIYLFHIKKSCKVSRLMVVPNTTEVVEQFFTYVTTQTSITRGNVGCHLAISLDTMDPKKDVKYSQDHTAYIDYSGYKNKSVVKVTYGILPNNTLKPYMKLFQNVGDMDIDFLTIENNKEPFLLDIVFDNFTKLKGLQLESSNDITFNKTGLEMKSQVMLESLKFHHCELKKEMITEISKRCPKLKYFEMSYCYFHNDILLHNSKGILQYVSIDMKSACLFQLSICVSLENYFTFHKYSKMFIRLKTASKKTRYCKLALEELSNSSLKTDFVYNHFTDADYKAHLKDTKCVVYTIHCEAVKTFVVTSEGKKRRIFLEENP